jgi:uncharacterized protein DUF6298/collagenase-like protein with putative collagen-binding domain
MAKKYLSPRFIFLLMFTCISGFSQSSDEAGATGPLRVHPTNPRYFTDGSLKAIYMTGSHERNNFQLSTKPDHLSVFNYNNYLNLLNENKHNFIRLWVWEHGEWNPVPYVRSGPGMANDGQLQFDLNQFDQTYFDELRARVIAARDRGIYVGVMLFQGWSIANGSYAPGYVAWDLHPFNSKNNSNAINGDADNDGEGREVHTLQLPVIVDLQKAYIRKVIDTLNDLDNIIWEISNESPPESIPWQYEMIKFIKEYEVRKPKQHLVWMSAASDEPGNSALFGSPADVISPSSSESTGWTYRTNPPAADGKKIIINDTDHLDGKTVAPELVWKSFTRGIHLIIIDGGLNGFDWPYNPEVRPAMSQTRSYAERMNLAVMAPQPNLSSTTYVLANPGSEYLIYQPGSGSFTVELKKNKYKYEWFNPLTVRIVQYGTLSAGDGKREFSPPFSGQAVLYLKSSELQ